MKMSDFEQNGTPSSPKLEDLPKIPDALAEEVTGQHDLKHVETDEKVVLPSAEGNLSLSVITIARITCPLCGNLLSSVGCTHSVCVRSRFATETICC